jgi:hypothetical protein
MNGFLPVDKNLCKAATKRFPENPELMRIYGDPGNDPQYDSRA